MASCVPSVGIGTCTDVLRRVLGTAPVSALVGVASPMLSAPNRSLAIWVAALRGSTADTPTPKRSRRPPSASARITAVTDG